MVSRAICEILSNFEPKYPPVFSAYEDEIMALVSGIH